MSKYSTLHLALQELTEKVNKDEQYPEEHTSCIYDDYRSDYNINKGTCVINENHSIEGCMPCRTCVACSPIRLKRIDSELRSLL